MVREVAVELEVQRDEFAGQMLEHPRCHNTRHAIARIDHHLERLDLAHVNKREHVVNIIVGDVALRHYSFSSGFWKISMHCQVANIG